MRFRQIFGILCLVAIAWAAFSYNRTAQAIPTNLSPAGAATISTVYADDEATYGAFHGNDGNRAGDSIVHTWSADQWDTLGGGAEPEPAWFQVDLGADYYLDRVQIFPRDLSQGTVGNFTIEVLNSANQVVFSQSYLPNNATDQSRLPPPYDSISFPTGSSVWGTTDIRNVLGRTVRLTRNDTFNPSMTFAEFEVYGQSTPIVLENLALGRPVTATDPIQGYGDILATYGNDGDIGGNFYHYSVYHSSWDVTPVTGHFWQVELDAVSEIDYVTLYARSDDTQFNDYVQLSVLAADGVTVVDSVEIFLGDLDNGAIRYDFTHDFATNPLGKYVRLETLTENALMFSELEVFGTSTVTLAPGDFDGDGDVDGADFVVWQTNFPTETGATLATGDADGDGDVDGADFVIWQTNFPFTPSPAVAAVPEPVSIGLLAIGGLIALARRRMWHP